MSDDSSVKLYSQRDDWADVQPLEQYEGVTPLVPIFYSEPYKDASGYLRAIVQSQEKSHRVLELTEFIIRQNPGHYTAWQYRWQTLNAINSPLDVELKLMDELAAKYLKTYQVWHHRRLLVTALRKPLAELDFISVVLEQDTKNYHTWSYRQWLLSYFDRPEEDCEGKDVLWDGELAFAEKMVREDIRNNSAWHHRFFVVFREKKEIPEDVVKREIQYTKEMISVAPNNASSWNYLRGVLDRTGTPYHSVKEFVELYTVNRYEGSDDDVLDVSNPGPQRGSHLPAIPAVEFLADILEQEGGANIPKAIEIWKNLGNDLDKVRKNYWDFRIRDARPAT
ncbi:hypothetical protein DL96DRAFT_1668849 [Flagelloscypha sp. PMI_526]|nr:hypothetical protein DL96DRAFT_1668849 [Flagelloscypha sp. PMI_526]